MRIISFNFNSWKPMTKLPYSKKINGFVDHIRTQYQASDVIAIQEFITGGGKYLDELYQAFRGEYHIVTPPSFDYRSHPKSLVCLLLLKKSSVGKYRVHDPNVCLPNRVAYVTVWISGTPWKIMNIYAVQVANFAGKADWYVAERKRLHKELWEEILGEARQSAKERMIILGDCQESSEGEHISVLKEAGYREVTSGLPTVKNKFFDETCIDHIFFSGDAYSEYQPSGFSVDADLVNTLSDHCLLSVRSA